MAYNVHRRINGECRKMRPRMLSFEQLVRQNKQELMRDEDTIRKIELRLENKLQKYAEEKEEQAVRY